MVHTCHPKYLESKIQGQSGQLSRTPSQNIILKWPGVNHWDNAPGFNPQCQTKERRKEGRKEGWKGREREIESMCLGPVT